MTTQATTQYTSGDLPPYTHCPVHPHVELYGTVLASHVDAESVSGFIGCPICQGGSVQPDPIYTALEIIRERRAIYVEKQKGSDEADDDTCNEWEKIEHTIEAIGHLYDELAASIGLVSVPPIVGEPEVCCKGGDTWGHAADCPRLPTIPPAKLDYAT